MILGKCRKSVLSIIILYITTHKHNVQAQNRELLDTVTCTALYMMEFQKDRHPTVRSGSEVGHSFLISEHHTQCMMTCTCSPHDCGFGESFDARVLLT